MKTNLLNQQFVSNVASKIFNIPSQTQAFKRRKSISCNKKLCEILIIGWLFMS